MASMANKEWKFFKAQEPSQEPPTDPGLYIVEEGPVGMFNNNNKISPLIVFLIFIYLFFFSPFTESAPTTRTRIEKLEEQRRKSDQEILELKNKGAKQDQEILEIKNKMENLSNNNILCDCITTVYQYILEKANKLLDDDGSTSFFQSCKSMSLPSLFLPTNHSSALCLFC